MLGFFYDKLLGKYCVPFLGSDKSVITRTQHLNYCFNQVKPVLINNFWIVSSLTCNKLICFKFNYSPFMTINSLTNVLRFIVYGTIFSILVKFAFGRRLLLKVNLTYNQTHDITIENEIKISSIIDFFQMEWFQNRMTKLIM